MPYAMQKAPGMPSASMWSAQQSFPGLPGSQLYSGHGLLPCSMPPGGGVGQQSNGVSWASSGGALHSLLGPQALAGAAGVVSGFGLEQQHEVRCSFRLHQLGSASGWLSWRLGCTRVFAQRQL